jgi:hypothetical protein
MTTRTLEFLAIILMAIALVPSGAHLFALSNKMPLGRDAYFTVQQIYAGWALFGIVLFASLIVNGALAVLMRNDRPAFIFALVAVVAVVANLAIFFIWTFPANQATANWTGIPENWETLRSQWEYSHAANAIVMFLGFCSVTLAALSASR